jgi:beta-glucosidase
VLFANDGADFKGRLSYSWPNLKCSTTINRHAPNIPNYTTPVDGITGDVIEQNIEGTDKPLFPYGYGLSYENSTSTSVTSDLNNLPLDPRDYGCGQTGRDVSVASDNLEIFGRASSNEFIARISGSINAWSGVDVSNGQETSIGSVTTKPINYKHQQDALNVTFTGDSEAQIYIQTANEKGVDKYSYLNANAVLEFDIDMKSVAPNSLVLSTHCEWPCHGELNINNLLPKPSAINETRWTTIKIPLSCLAEQGMDFTNTNTPFLLYSQEAVEFNLGEIRYVPGSLGAAEDEINCDSLSATNSD